MTNGEWRERVEKTRKAVYAAVLDGHERQVAIIKASGLSGNTVHARLKDLEGEHLIRKKPGGQYIPLVWEFMQDLLQVGRVFQNCPELMAQDGPDPDRQLAADLAPGQNPRANRQAEDPDRRRMEIMLRPPLEERTLHLLGTMHDLRLMVEGMTDAEFSRFEEDFP